MFDLELNLERWHILVVIHEIFLCVLLQMQDHFSPRCTKLRQLWNRANAAITKFPQLCQLRASG